MQQIKGSVLKSRMSYVEEQAGADGVARVLAALTPEDRSTLSRILTVQWYPFEISRRLDDAIVKTLGEGRPEFFERLGAASAKRNLATVHQGFLSPGRPHDFLGKAPQIYRMYYETGRREYHQTGERSGELTTHDAETFSAPDCLTVVGWYRQALAMCGVPDARISEVECRATGGSVCRYRIEWGEPAAR